jgi:oligoendopeptidase F
MTETKLRVRNEIPAEFKWNQASVFPNDQAWNEAADRLPEMIRKIEQFQGRLAEGPEVLQGAMHALEEAYMLLGKVLVYASVSHAVDMADTNPIRMQGKAYGLFGQLQSAAAYLDPELVAIGKPVLDGWMEKEADLKTYAHYADNLFRKQSHVRSAEVEEVLGGLAPAFSSTGETATLLTDADFVFSPASAEDGSQIPVTQSTLHDILASPDREARRTAWENYMDTYLAHKNTLASNLNTSIQQNVFNARVRRYPSTLEASLFENAVPAAVFHNLIETTRRNLPVWHRYFKARRKALKVDKLHTYDIWAPLTAHHPVIPYLQAVDLISAGLAPMGEEYVQALRRGCLEESWIDVYPCQGKSSAQFSAGWWGTYPFIVISYDDSIFSLSTLAHELGHSMHSYYTWKTQPVIYSDYSLFVAEVASNFHQAMVRANLLATNADPDFQISVIEEAMDNFHRYFFIMPTLARFELEMHQRAERGEGLTADDMIKRMGELYAEGYGEEVELDPERDGMTWATFGHLYQDYYVYNYATGISGANALSRGILTGKAGAAERYINLLKSGSSAYPVEVLKGAGVDLTQPQAVEETFQVLEGLVARLEKLTQG